MTINTDKALTFRPAIAGLKVEGKLPEEVVHRHVKYLNNVVEAAHGKLKQLIKPVRGFKSIKTAYATIKGFEVMHALREAKPRSSSMAAASWEKCVRSKGSSTPTPHKGPKRGRVQPTQLFATEPSRTGSSSCCTKPVI